MTKQFSNSVSYERKNAGVIAGRIGPQPCNRDDFSAGFAVYGNRSGSRHILPAAKSGQNLAGSGALVFEGELLEIPAWN